MVDVQFISEMLARCAICGEVNRELGGTSVVFQLRSPEGNTGTFAAHSSCVLGAMHPTARALLQTGPDSAEGKGSEITQLISAEQHTTVAVTVSMYPDKNVDRQSLEVLNFLEAARERLMPGVSMAGGPQDQEIPPDLHVPLVMFYFEPDLPSERIWDIRDWGLGHPLVRVIEIESQAPDAPAP